MADRQPADAGKIDRFQALGDDVGDVGAALAAVKGAEPDAAAASAASASRTASSSDDTLRPGASIWEIVRSYAE